MHLRLQARYSLHIHPLEMILESGSSDEETAMKMTMTESSMSTLLTTMKVHPIIILIIKWVYLNWKYAQALADSRRPAYIFKTENNYNDEDPQTDASMSWKRDTQSGLRILYSFLFSIFHYAAHSHTSTHDNTHTHIPKQPSKTLRLTHRWMHLAEHGDTHDSRAY